MRLAADTRPALRDPGPVAWALIAFGLHTPRAQALAARHHYRPVYPQHAAAEDLRKFPRVSTFTIEEAAGGWARASAEHVADGGVFDQIMGAAR